MDNAAWQVAAGLGEARLGKTRFTIGVQTWASMGLCGVDWADDTGRP